MQWLRTALVLAIGLPWCAVLMALAALREGLPKSPRVPKGMRQIVTGGNPVLVSEADYQARLALHTDIAKCEKASSGLPSRSSSSRWWRWPRSRSLG